MAVLVAGESPLGAAASAWPPAPRRLRRRRALRRWRCFRGHRVQAPGHLPQPHGMAGAAARRALSMALSFMIMLPNLSTLAAPSSSRSFHLVQRARRRHTAWVRGDPLHFLTKRTAACTSSVRANYVRRYKLGTGPVWKQANCLLPCLLAWPCGTESPPRKKPPAHSRLVGPAERGPPVGADGLSF